MAERSRARLARTKPAGGDGRVRAGHRRGLRPWSTAAAFPPSASPASRCASRRTASPTDTISCAWCSLAAGRSRAALTRSTCRRRGTTCGPRNSRRLRPDATNVPLSRGWITSSPGARSSSGARSSPTSASRCSRQRARLADRGPRRRATHAPLEDWAPLLRDSARPDSTADASTLKALALDPERARLMRRHCGPRPRRIGRARDCRGSQTRGVQQLVRAVPPLRLTAARRGTGISRTSRRACPTSPRWASMCCTSRPSSRSDGEPQGPEQRAEGAARRRRQPLGDRLRRRRPQGDPAGARHRSRISGTSRPRRASSASRSRSTSHFSARPIIPTSARIPQWFKHRPDGSVQYAENPPKKYQDIYPFDFETDDWRALWDELKSVVDFWIDAGRADLPRRQSAHQAVSRSGNG